MKKIALFLFLLLLLNSCLDTGGNYMKYDGWIYTDQISIPDTAIVGDSISLYVKGGAPNSCWYNLVLNLTKQSDTLYYIAGTGTYESTDGLCAEIYQVVDTNFIFKPLNAGKYMFIAKSPGQPDIKDSLIAISAKGVNGR
ncbi:MAG: hypothetical protein WCQ70_01785 [Lentimicrobiaceae bacterium]